MPALLFVVSGTIPVGTTAGLATGISVRPPCSSNDVLLVARSLNAASCSGARTYGHWTCTLSRLYGFVQVHQDVRLIASRSCM